MDDALIGQASRLQGLIARLQKHLRRRSNRALLPYGLTSSGHLGLMLVDQSGSVSSADLAKLMSVHPSTMTRTIDSLEKKNLVERQPRHLHEDRREGLITITEEGKNLLRQIDARKQYAPLVSVLARVFQSDVERESFISKLSELSSEVTGAELSREYEELLSAGCKTQCTTDSPRQQPPADGSDHSQFTAE